MDCPNCHFQIGDDSEACPFCAFVIPAKGPAPGASWKPVAFADQSPPAAAGAKQPEAAAVPTEIEPIQARKQSGAFLYFLAAAIIGTLGYFQFFRAKPAPEPPAQAQAPKAPEPAAKPPSQPPPQKAAPAPEAKPVEPPEPPAAKPAPPPPAAYWEFEGRVYDVLTLKPVPNVDMTFYSDDGNLQTKSAKDGRYRMRVPALRTGGYRLAADHPDYIEEYFDEAGAGFEKMPLTERAALRNANPNNQPWAAPGAASVRRNVVLFPLVPDR